MLLVQHDEFNKLREAGLIRDNKYDKNYRIVNKGKKNGHKKYFVMEENKILSFLNIQQ